MKPQMPYLCNQYIGKPAEIAQFVEHDLAKVVLYQLSYFRVIMSSFPNAMQRYDFF